LLRFTESREDGTLGPLRVWAFDGASGERALVGAYALSDIRTKGQAAPRVGVTFVLDARGVLAVSARDGRR
jgi:hypothetical protein